MLQYVRGAAQSCQAHMRSHLLRIYRNTHAHTHTHILVAVNPIFCVCAKQDNGKCPAGSRALRTMANNVTHTPRMPAAIQSCARVWVCCLPAHYSLLNKKSLLRVRKGWPTQLCNIWAQNMQDSVISICLCLSLPLSLSLAGLALNLNSELLRVYCFKSRGKR